MVELYLYSPMRLLGVVLNRLIKCIDKFTLHFTSIRHQCHWCHSNSTLCSQSPVINCEIAPVLVHRIMRAYRG
jgi:hypothetical protein